MSAESVLLQELKKEILEYLERERFRASTSAITAERGSSGQCECAARAHESNNILTVISGIFAKKEKALSGQETVKEEPKAGPPEET